MDKVVGIDSDDNNYHYQYQYQYQYNDKKREDKKRKKPRLLLKFYYPKKNKIIKNIKDYKCNQPHIFRIKTLHLIYEQIAFLIFKNQLKLNLGDMRLFYNGLTIHFDNLGYYQAEITGSERLTIGERLKLHIKLLRLLKQGKTVKRAVKKVMLCGFK